MHVMTSVPADPALQVEAFFDAATSTVTWLVLDPASRRCAIVDSVLDYDASSGRTGSAGAERLLARVAELGATVQWILETHIHADHLSAAHWIRCRRRSWRSIARRSGWSRPSPSSATARGCSSSSRSARPRRPGRPPSVQIRVGR